MAFQTSSVPVLTSINPYLSDAHPRMAHKLMQQRHLKHVPDGQQLDLQKGYLLDS